ncbi:MAG: APC family permease, partial [Myxococcota bacterium]
MTTTSKLKKELTLFDVYAISTGAMFSSGFFLLPGLAAAQTGSSVPLAYLLAGILILPAMLSVAELATAMPRAGGAYYFLDRSMGPMMGTIGGLGTWLALVLKSAFALLGMGAYMVLFFDIPIEPLAVVLTVLFAAVNIFGAKETTVLQRILVSALVSILFFFIAQGVFTVFIAGTVAAPVSGSDPFLLGGLDGLFATVGVVFVSYAGLTKVASVAEEVHDPDRNIPLGMALSLLTATAIYVVGAEIMVVALEPDMFHSVLTPVAAAGDAVFTWIPKSVGLGLIVVAAIAAFASTGNAGILSSSRYPMAMARDQLMPDAFARLSRFQTPTLGIVVTALLMILLIVAFDIRAVAKLASAFQLMLFGLLSLAVIVMRESRIAYYRPGFRSPFYPWVQIAGMIIPVWLIVEMGWLAILFTAGIVVLGVVWYMLYARDRVERGGAIYHVFERLGRRVWRGLDDELRTIMAEKGLNAEDPLEELVTRADVLDLNDPIAYSDAVHLATLSLARTLGIPDHEEIALRILHQTEQGMVPTTHHAALPHLLVDHLDQPHLVLVRAPEGLTGYSSESPLFALFGLMQDAQSDLFMVG